MKRILCLTLVLIMALSSLALVSCGEKTPDQNDATLKLGLGVYTVVSSASNAEGEKNGQSEVTVNAAAVTVDENGKIVDCAFDAMDHTLSYTSDGKAIAADSFKTKHEMGDAYGMKAYGGAAKEWYEQADALRALVIGKTLDEVKALVAEDGKGTDDVVNAGCTILINELVLAIEKAYNNAKDSAAVAANTVKLGMSTAPAFADATEEKEGSAEVETTVFAAAVGADGKVSAADSDCVAVKITFDANGASTYNTESKITTKREQGDAYGMKAYGGAAKEWYEQADAFNAACIGKTADEISGVEASELQSAGCTIIVDGFVKAASKVN